MKIETKARDLKKLLKQAEKEFNESKSIKIDENSNLDKNNSSAVKVRNLGNGLNKDKKQKAGGLKLNKFNIFKGKKNIKIQNNKKQKIKTPVFLGNDVKQKINPNQANKLNVDITLVLAVVGLVLTGMAYLASALSSKNGEVFKSNFTEQTIFIFIGTAICYVLFKLDYHKIVKNYKIILYPGIFLLSLLFLVSLLALIGAVFGMGSFSSLQAKLANQSGIVIYSQGAARWLNFFGKLNIQPAEIMKLGVLVYLASVLKSEPVVKKLAKPAITVIFILGAVIMQPDLGSTVILFLIVLTAMWVAGIKLNYFITLLLIAVILGSYFIFGVSFRNKRVQIWAYQNFCSQYNLADLQRNIPKKEDRPGICGMFDFNINLADDNYQTRNIRLALAEGSWFGVGYNKGEMKSVIPESTNDGIIGVIGEEGGFMMITFILVMYLLVFLRGMKIADNAPDLEGKILASGISVWIIVQAFWNVTGMTGLVPMKGLPLPFISEGGTAMVSNLLAIGILLNISSQSSANKKVPNRVKNFEYK